MPTPGTPETAPEAPTTAPVEVPAPAPTPEPAQVAPETAPAPTTPPASPYADTADSEPPSDITLEDLLNDPIIARELKNRTQQQVTSALEAQQKKLATEQERAKMEESDRLRAEKADEEARRIAAEKKASDLMLDSEFSTAFMRSGTQLANPASIDFIKSQARATMEAEGLSMEACVAEVLEKHAYLVAPPQAPQPVAPAPPPPAASSVPPAQVKHTETPAQETPKNSVDTRNMTPQEYKRYRRETHGF